MITLLLVLKLFQSTKLTSRIPFFYFLTSSRCICFFCPFFSFFLKKVSLHPLGFFFKIYLLKKVKISNYNKYKLLIFIKKLKELLSMHVRLISINKVAFSKRIKINKVMTLNKI